MKIHEYQAKRILRKFGVPVPDGEVAITKEGAEKIANGLGFPVIVKAQIHAGGRGKGGGIKLARGMDELRAAVKKILGMNLVTHQTGPEGKLVSRVYIEKASDIAREVYLGITLDRSTSRLTIIASPEGGMEIEKVAVKNPEKIFKLPIDPDVGVVVHDARDLGEKLGLRGDLNNKFIDFVENLYKAYIESDASLAEINPLVVTKDGGLIALDAKMNFDDNALYRQDEIRGMMDPHEENPAELHAKEFDLSYISLDGNIGCMVNGAGLAMATMDIIKLYGGAPANFLDVGGASTEENVKEAFRIILTDKKVAAILVNIFGGIVKCDMIADGITKAAADLSIKVPLVVRLQGTNVEKGREILKKSGLNIISADTLDDAAKKVVEVASGNLGR